MTAAPTTSVRGELRETWELRNAATLALIKTEERTRRVLEQASVEELVALIESFSPARSPSVEWTRGFEPLVERIWTWCSPATVQAVHETFADHDMDLPNGRNPDRQFGNQRFVHHIAARTPWTTFGTGEAQETGIRDATGRLADVRTIRPSGGLPIDFPAHRGELVFGFILSGTAFLDFGTGASVGPADSFVIPPGEPWRLTDVSDDLRLLHVTTASLG